MADIGGHLEQHLFPKGTVQLRLVPAGEDLFAQPEPEQGATFPEMAHEHEAYEGQVATDRVGTRRLSSGRACGVIVGWVVAMSAVACDGMANEQPSTSGPAAPATTSQSATTEQSSEPEMPTPRDSVATNRPAPANTTNEAMNPVSRATDAGGAGGMSAQRAPITPDAGGGSAALSPDASMSDGGVLLPTSDAGRLPNPVTLPPAVANPAPPDPSCTSTPSAEDSAAACSTDYSCDDGDSFHLGCSWNAAQETWDCECRSRSFRLYYATAETACGVMFDTCRADATFEGDEYCSPPAQLDSEPDAPSLCELATRCGRTANLGQGIVGQELSTDYTSACYFQEPGSPAYCRCDDPFNEFQVDWTSIDWQTACALTNQLCRNGFETSGDPQCSRTNVALGAGVHNCFTTQNCLASVSSTGDVPTQVTARINGLSCDRVGDIWQCRCQHIDRLAGTDDTTPSWDVVDDTSDDRAVCESQVDECFQ